MTLEQRSVIWSSSSSCSAEMLSNYIKYWRFHCNKNTPMDPQSNLSLSCKSEYGCKEAFQIKATQVCEDFPTSPSYQWARPLSLCLLPLGLLRTGFLTFYCRAGLRQRLLSIISACTWPIMASQQSWLPVSASIDLLFFCVSISQFKVWAKHQAPFFLSLLCHKSLALAQEPMHRPGEHGNHGCQGGRMRVRHGHAQSSWRHA